jgi:hypothetical protein
VRTARALALPSAQRRGVFVLTLTGTARRAASALTWCDPGLSRPRASIVGQTKDSTTPLAPDMLLKCSRCGRWHEVFEEPRAAGTSAEGMLFWRCGSAKYFAGHAGKSSRHPAKRAGGAARRQ